MSRDIKYIGMDVHKEVTVSAVLNGSGKLVMKSIVETKARAVLLRVKYDTGGFGQWVHRLAQRAPRNKVIVAIANKLARIAWAVLSSGKDYQHQSLLQMTAA